MGHARAVGGPDARREGREGRPEDPAVRAGRGGHSGGRGGLDWRGARRVHRLRDRGRVHGRPAEREQDEHQQVLRALQVVTAFTGAPFRGIM